MGNASVKLEGHIRHSICDVAASTWNECANPTSRPYNPFVDHRFFRALEESGSVSAETGWQPFHIELKSQEQTLGVVPMYVKSHSRGEFVFDGSWANAWYGAGGQYYPKLQVSIPFTPATGPRLLTSADGLDGPVEDQLLHTIAQVTRKLQLSSAHITFMTKDQWDRAGRLGWLQRIDTQFHWYNPNYTSFDEFLSELSSKKRKNIRRERREAVKNGISIEWITGSDLREHHWDAFYKFYVDTGYRKWGHPYLNREFFSLVSELMPDRTLLILCKRDGEYIAGAINFLGDDTIFGRNWGCSEDHRFLHFETCYYQAIDFAIAHKLEHVEAGAQGGHKIARGYLPRSTYSAHYIADTSFRHAVARFLEEEKQFVAHDIEYIEQRSPFRRDIDLTKFRQRTTI
ncbi:MAG: GNAT family N-acetyltransferase [Gammaproteobacteria bacterium]|nr:GNAT family N-acetyltransferase [Gammaproteobacteria bacterium]